MNTAKKLRSRIAGIALSQPSRIFTNDDMAKIVDTSDEWVRTRTGIKQRNFIDPEKGENHTQLSVDSSKKAMAMAGIEGKDLDLIICSTMSPETYMPMASCRIAHALGASKVGAFDLNTACTGFLSAIHTADSFIRSGVYKNVLVVSTEVFSPILDWKDRKTCVLFGDGSGAALLQATEVEDERSESMIIGSQLWCLPDMNENLLLKGGGTRHPELRPHITMEGQEVFKTGSRAMAEAAQFILNKCGYKASEVDWLVPHQANLRIIEMVAKLAEFPMDKVYVNVDRWGNTSAATVPICLAEMHAKGLLKRGQLLLLDVFGGGFNYGSMLVRW